MKPFSQITVVVRERPEDEEKAAKGKSGAKAAAAAKEAE